MKNKFKLAKTPLRKYPVISKNLGIELWIKHDDQIPRACGGNKVRKLYRIFNDTSKFKYNAIVTSGGIFSNHIISAALLAAEKGWKARIIIHERKPLKVTANLKIAYLAGANITFCKHADVKVAMKRAMNEMKLSGYKPLYVWGGGHSASGIKAFQDAALEINKQCKKIKLNQNILWLLVVQDRRKLD